VRERSVVVRIMDGSLNKVSLLENPRVCNGHDLRLASGKQCRKEKAFAFVVAGRNVINAIISGNGELR
jgi:hypothetical protein